MTISTICAISTPLGTGGIGIVRLSGIKAHKIASEIFRPAKKTNILSAPSHTVHYGHIVDGEKTVDEVLITLMKKPRSYTRENMVEIGCHGGIIPLKEVLSLCIKKGAVPAEPGEFTKRAFLNGRIDLAQAESVLEIIHSKTPMALKLASEKLKGQLSTELSSIQKSLLAIIAEIEAQINFPEEDTVKSHDFKTAEKIKELSSFTAGLLSRAGKGKIIQQGVNAAIIGRTNAGKSSLLNALLRENRAIVTAIHGTTRDTIQETINVRGIPVNIIDTAGIRKVSGKIEKMGVEKALQWMQKAEINLIMLDGSKKLNEYDRRLLREGKEKNRLIVINKNDLPIKIETDCLKKDVPKSEIVFISAKTGDGIPQLEEKIYRLISEGHGEIKGDEMFLNIRQEGKIREANGLLKQAEKDIKSNAGLEIIAEHLKSCMKNIDAVKGTDVSEDVLNQIFSGFCIGK